jgi:membrane protein DedA with SNARE-associated domain
MPWHSFLLWNALGGIVWATLIGLIAYFLGHSAGNAVQTFGLIGLIAAAAAIVSAVWLHRRHRRARRPDARRAAPPAARPPLDPPPPQGE